MECDAFVSLLFLYIVLYTQKYIGRKTLIPFHLKIYVHINLYRDDGVDHCIGRI